MASYFNRTRGPVNVSLRDGSPLLVGPKATVNIDSRQDGSASLHAAVRRGLLIRLKEKVSRPVSPPEKQVPIESASPPPPEPDDVPEDEAETPSMEWRKSELAEHAEALGLEVPSSWTKVEILEAIEGAG